MPVAAGVVAQTAVPLAEPDGSVKGPWLSRHGAQIVHARGVSPFDALDPILYRALTATFGTGIGMGTATRATFSDTEATAFIQNNAGAGGRYVIPLYLRFIITAAGTAGTNCNFGLRVNQAPRTVGGTLLVPNPVKSDSALTPDAVVNVGQVTLSASPGSVRQLGRAIALQRAAAPAFVVGDEILLTFGSAESVPPQVLAATAARYVVPFGPIALAPQANLAIHYWSTAQTATPSAEYELGWAEL